MIRPADELGRVLAGRAHAAAVRKRVETALREGDSVVLDFEGVEAMSPSFADELFAKLDRGVADDRIRFEHLGDDLRALANYVIQGRARSGE